MYVGNRHKLKFKWFKSIIRSVKGLTQVLLKFNFTQFYVQ